MQTITFNCEVITPMFLGGANPNDVELRAPSIKGALRFWWRAMHGDWSLDKLKTEEAKLFGGSEKLSYIEGGKKIEYEPGKSSVIVRVSNVGKSFISKEEFEGTTIKTYYSPTRKEKNSKLPESFKIDILKYLAFGPYQKNKLLHYYIKPQTKFKITITISEEYAKKEILSAMALLSQYGSLGSKGRNGFGCFQINNPTIEPIDILNFKYRVASYTSFSEKSKIVYQSQPKFSWQEALSEIGLRYQKAREKIEKWGTYRKRILLTQPIIVNKKEADGTIFQDGRHAKPYFLNVSKNQDNRYIGKILCMPYKFLDNNEHFTNEHLSEYNKSIEEFNSLLKDNQGVKG